MAQIDGVRDGGSGGWWRELEQDGAMAAGWSGKMAAGMAAAAKTETGMAVAMRAM